MTEPSDVEIRVMRTDEFAEMRAVCIRAFGDDSLGVLLDALRASWAWSDELSFVAELDGVIVGQVLYTSAIVDAPERLEDVLVLSPIGVEPSLQGQAIGTRLVTRTLEVLAATRPEPLVFLEGNPRYYHRFGFESAEARGLLRPSDRTPEPAFQVIDLGDGSDMTGRLVYPDAFWRTDSVGLR